MRTTLAVLAMFLLGSCSSSPLPGDCSHSECFRAYECRTSCTAPVTSSGCCPCPAGTFDDLGVCLPDGGMRDGG